MKLKLQTLLGVVLSFSIASNGFAMAGAAIGNENLSARSAGQGYVAVAGVNDDPSTVYSNPAAMTALPGTQATTGLTWENLHGNYEDGPGGASSKMRSIDVAVPNFAVTQSLMDGKMGAGLSVESPYGLETHWPGDGSLRYIATNSVLHMVVVSPAVAYQLTPMVSLGVGADYFNTFDASLEKNVNVDDVNTALGAPTAGTPDGVSKLSGTAANWGFHTGVTFKPSEQHSFGLVYRSKVKLNVNGSVSLTGLSGASALVFGGSNYTTSAYTDLYIPQTVQFGYAYRPTEKWAFEADAAWVDWWSNRDLNIRYSETDPTRLAVLTNGGAGNPTPLSWRDTWNVATGVNYKATEKLQVRTGFWYEPWAEPESAFSPAIMDLTRYGLSLGAGYGITAALTLDVAYNAVFTHNRTINNNTGLNSTGDPRVSANGEYKNFANLVSVNLTYRFGNRK